MLLGVGSFVVWGMACASPIQRIYTTLGWLQREMDTVARPDSCLAGKVHIDRYGASGVRCPGAVVTLAAEKGERLGGLRS